MLPNIKYTRLTSDSDNMVSKIPKDANGRPNKNGINLLSFNVEGLESMLLDPSFSDLINNHDVCLLSETMRKDDTKLNLDNFWDFSLIRPKNKKAGRHSGG